MAEYYAVLKKAVGGLEAGSAEARRAVYDKARNALIGQLKAIDPPLPASEISRQRLELEEAIRRVERETASETRRSRLPLKSETAPPAANATAPTAPPQQPDTHSPQDVFRRAIQDAEARGAASAQPPKPPRPVAAYDEDDATVRAPSNWTRPEYRETGSRGDSAPEVPTDLEDEWQADDAELDQSPESYAERRGRSRPPRRQQEDDYFEEDEAPPPTQPKRRSRLATILVFLLIVVLIGGAGALAWTQRAIITDIMASFQSGMSDTAAPETAPAPPATQSKSEDRLADGTDQSSVRVIGDSSVPAPPAPPAPSATAPDPIGETIADLPAQTSAATAGAQKAVLYEEPLDAAAAQQGVTAIDASIVWRFVEDGTSGAEITADIEVPDRGMTVRLVIRRNTDPTLPASHLVETLITTPPDFPGTGIRSVPRLVLKPTENERGAPLIGAAAKVADGFFWIALSAAEADVKRNLELLRESPWIDLPMVYENGQRAILTFEKGPQGTEVFENAFAAWSAG